METETTGTRKLEAKATGTIKMKTAAMDTHSLSCSHLVVQVRVYHQRNISLVYRTRLYKLRRTHRRAALAVVAVAVAAVVVAVVAAVAVVTAAAHVSP